MEKIDIFDDTRKYYMDGSYMIAMNGEPDKWTNFTHAFNTFLNYFWIDFFGGGFWAQDQFLMDDIRETQEKFIELVNSPEGEDRMTIGMLTFIEGIKPAPQWSMKKGDYIYPNPMTYYSNKEDDKIYGEHGYHPRQLFVKIMELLKHDSIQEIVRQELKSAGLPYMNIVNNGN